MTDRELLEAAARAAGYDVTFWGLPGEQRHWQCRMGVNCDARAQGVKWNPLTDDGDALRLAVKASIKIGYWGSSGPGPSGGSAVAEYYDRRTAGRTSRDGWVMVLEDEGADLCAATRRVIVRAAAEIGKAAAQDHRSSVPSGSNKIDPDS